MIRGSCLCGRICYEIRGRPQHMYYCHCCMCRKATGSSFATNMWVRAEDFVLIAGQEHMKPYRSSPGELRYFCPRCGSPICSEAEDRRGILSIRCGLLDNDPAIRPAHHIYAGFKAPWFEPGDGLPVHAGAPPPDSPKT